MVVATVAGFFLSYVWFTPLFGKAWAQEMGFDRKEVLSTPKLIKSLLLTLVSVFFITLVLPNLLQGVAWEKRSGKLFAIDAGYYMTLLLTLAFITVYLR